MSAGDALCQALQTALVEPFLRWHAVGGSSSIGIMNLKNTALDGVKSEDKNR
jgi:hypothetical protein